MQTFSRRHIVQLAGVLALSSPTAAQENAQYPLTDDDGGAVPNYRIPSDLDPLRLPGILYTGAAVPDVIFCEFFDYNCPHCRKAAPDIDDIISQDNSFSLALINNPILSPGSVEAAHVQQAVLRAYGPEAANLFHRRLLGIRGPANHATALAVASDIQLDADAVEAGARDSHVIAVVVAQTKLAADIDLSATPSFTINLLALLGWPGRKTFASMISAMRKCDRPVCPG